MSGSRTAPLVSFEKSKTKRKTAVARKLDPCRGNSVVGSAAARGEQTLRNIQTERVVNPITRAHPPLGLCPRLRPLPRPRLRATFLSISLRLESRHRHSVLAGGDSPIDTPITTLGHACRQAALCTMYCVQCTVVGAQPYRTASVGELWTVGAYQLWVFIRATGGQLLAGE